MAVALGIVGDTVFISVTRCLLRWCGDMIRPGRIAALLLVNCALAFGLIVVPGRLSSVLSPAALANSIDALTSLVFAILALALLGHRLLWPVTERAIYALQGLGIARRRRLFGTVGVALFGYAGLGSPELLKKVIEVFVG